MYSQAHVSSKTARAWPSVIVGTEKVSVGSGGARVCGNAAGGKMDAPRCPSQAEALGEAQSP